MTYCVVKANLAYPIAHFDENAELKEHQKHIELQDQIVREKDSA
jgi:hypothetical protein